MKKRYLIGSQFYLISTDVQSGDFSGNSSASWNGTYFLVDGIILDNAALPVSLSAFSVD